MALNYIIDKEKILKFHIVLLFRSLLWILWGQEMLIFHCFYQKLICLVDFKMMLKRHSCVQCNMRLKELLRLELWVNLSLFLLRIQIVKSVDIKKTILLKQEE